MHDSGSVPLRSTLIRRDEKNAADKWGLALDGKFTIGGQKVADFEAVVPSQIGGSKRTWSSRPAPSCPQPVAHFPRDRVISMKQKTKYA
jgi:hypothetical protein